MDESREAVETLVTEKPEFESKLRELLEIDKEQDVWEFDDIPLNAGEFGEVVSRGIAVETDTGYQLGNRESIRAVLDGDTSAETDSISVSLDSWISLDRVEYRWYAVVTAALIFVGIMRVVFVYESVFRNGDIVLHSNDPYAFRFYVESLVESDLSLFSVADLSDLETGELDLSRSSVLFILTLWLGAVLLGGTETAVGIVLAWYPVITAVLTAVLIYLITIRLTADRRTGVVAVLLFATIPAHAYRSVLGMGDHHAYQYLWLALTIYGLVRVLTTSSDFDPTDLRYWKEQGQLGSVLLVTVGITGQLSSWIAGPLLLAPFAVFVWTFVLFQVRNRDSPAVAVTPILAGVCLSTLMIGIFYFVLEWLQIFHVVTPPLLLCGTLLIAGVGEVAVRKSWRTRTTVLLSFGVGILLFAVAWMHPSVEGAVLKFIGYQSDKLSGQIADSMSLLSTRGGIFVNPILEVGFVFYFALPAIYWALSSGYRNRRPEWLVLGIYAAFFIVMSLNQIRFLGYLSLFVAILGATVFMRLADQIDLLTAPSLFDRSDVSSAKRVQIPSRTKSLQLLVLLLLFSSAGLLQTPIKQSQLQITDNEYTTAKWMGQHTSANESESSVGYVFSRWGSNRMYNYFVNGRSNKYLFAQRNYGPFVSSERVTVFTQRLEEQGTEFIVTEDLSGDLSERSMQHHLHRNWGSASHHIDRLGRYRAVYATDDGSHKVFSLVSGATIRWTSSANDSVRVERSNRVTIPGGSFEYYRAVHPVENGVYEVTVPYPGTYTVGNTTVRVNRTTVREGATVHIAGEQVFS